MRLTDVVTQEDRLSVLLVEHVQSSRQILQANPQYQCQGVMGTEIRVWKQLNSHWREKPLFSIKVPVPQTDTGRRGENPKTNGRTLVKELGKMTP